MNGWTRRHTLSALLAAGGSTIPLGWVYAEARKAQATPRPGDYMSSGLRDRVEALKAEAATTPTGDANYRERGLLLYDWMNAYALTGVYLHPEMPSVIAALYSPGFAGNGERQRRNAFSGIDRFIRTLAALEANPRLTGTVSARTEGPLTVDSYAQFEQTYTVGEASLSVGGGVVLPNHFYFASEELQTWNPKADNYVTVRASNPAVKIAPDTYPITGMFSSQLGVVEAQRVFFRITEGTLRPGESLTVTYGDRSQGSRGLKLIHISNTALRFPFWVHASRGDPPGARWPDRRRPWLWARRRGGRRAVPPLGPRRRHLPQPRHRRGAGLATDAERRGGPPPPALQQRDHRGRGSHPDEARSTPVRDRLGGRPNPRRGRPDPRRSQACRACLLGRDPRPLRLLRGHGAGRRLLQLRPR
jgi:hypothetical protein